MSDRTSAGIFAGIFTLIAAKLPAPAARPLARTIWGMSLEYDFSPSQMDAEDALETLGLCGRDEEGHFVYGPEGDRE